MNTDNKLAEMERAIREANPPCHCGGTVIHDRSCPAYDKKEYLIQRVLPVISRLLDAARATAGWKCFFCDEVFTDRHEAYLHFGEENCSSDVPACVDPLRTDEKARMNQVRQLMEDVQKARQELAEMEDAKENYEAVWSEIRRYFGEDCNSVWLAGDRYKSALNAVDAARDAAHADALRAAEKEARQFAVAGPAQFAAILAITPERAQLERELEVTRVIVAEVLFWNGWHVCDDEVFGAGIKCEACKRRVTNQQRLADLEAKLKRLP